MPTSAPSDSAGRPRQERRVGLNHIAFFRAYAEGLDLAKAGALYLDTGLDARKAKATLQWIRDELIAAARRQKPAVARILRIPPTKLAPEPVAPLSETRTPSLEEFQAERDPHGFYTEEELIALFRKELDARSPPTQDRRSKRNARLRERLVEAVNWLESWVPTTPAPEDPLLVWLDEAIAQRLNGYGILTVEDLVGTINRAGHRWYARVPKLGRVGAKRVIRWLQATKVMPITERALVPYRENAQRLATLRPQEFQIVPIDYLQIPDDQHDLSGATGTNRAYGTQLGATNDIEAIRAWLRSRRQGRDTQRSYTLHAERFLLWMIFERGKPFSSATTEDCTSYRNFLDALGEGKDWKWKLPREAWIGPKHYKRMDPCWKPFAGALSPVSQRLSITVLGILCNWLTGQRYLETNPWDGVAPVIDVHPRIKTDHALTQQQWEFVIQHCEKMSRDERYWRLKFLLWLAYSTGLRLFELCKATVGDIRESEDGEGYDLEVIGKRNKQRKVPLGRQLMAILAEYMDVREYGREYSLWAPELPLIASLARPLQHATEPGTPISDASVYNILVEHFRAVADEIGLEDIRAAERLKKASTHWLRHTCATHMVRGGTPLDVAQDLLGHRSPDTTALYISPGEERKREAVDRLLSKA